MKMIIFKTEKNKNKTGIKMQIKWQWKYKFNQMRWNWKCKLKQIDNKTNQHKDNKIPGKTQRTQNEGGIWEFPGKGSDWLGRSWGQSLLNLVGNKFDTSGGTNLTHCNILRNSHGECSGVVSTFCGHLGWDHLVSLRSWRTPQNLRRNLGSKIPKSSWIPNPTSSTTHWEGVSTSGDVQMGNVQIS